MDANGPALLASLLSTSRSPKVLLAVLAMLRDFAAAAGRSGVLAISRGGAAPAIVRLACPAAFGAPTAAGGAKTGADAPEVATAALSLLNDFSGSAEVRCLLQHCLVAGMHVPPCFPPPAALCTILERCRPFTWLQQRAHEPRAWPFARRCCMVEADQVVQTNYHFVSCIAFYGSRFY